MLTSIVQSEKHGDLFHLRLNPNILTCTADLWFFIRARHTYRQYTIISYDNVDTY